MAQSEYEDGRVLIYSLDRFLEVSRTDIKYEIPADFDVDEYFSAFYGVSCVNGTKAELVRLKVDAWQAKYFRSLPLHPSQQEMETTAGINLGLSDSSDKNRRAYIRSDQSLSHVRLFATP